MLISVLGRTDRRPVVYTLMKIFQSLGTESALLSDNHHYSRLTPDNTLTGTFQSTDIFISPLLGDEFFHETGRSPSEWDYVITDGKDFPNADLVFYAEGLGPEESDKHLLAALGDKCVTVKLGKSVFPLLEVFEYTKHIQQISPAITAQISKALSPLLGIPAQNLIRGVSLQ